MTIVGLDADTSSKYASLVEEGNWIRTLIPCPEQLRGDNYSVQKQSDIINYPWFQALSPEEQQERLAQALSDDEVQRRLDAFGAVEGYQWEYENYGTKWGDFEGSAYQDSDGTLTLNFTTAWSPAMKAYETISRMNPNAEFRLIYSESGCDFAGVAVFRDGLVEDRESSYSDIQKEVVQKQHPETDLGALAEDDEDAYYDLLCDADEGVWEVLEEALECLVKDSAFAAV